MGGLRIPPNLCAKALRVALCMGPMLPSKNGILHGIRQLLRHQFSKPGALSRSLQDFILVNVFLTPSQFTT